MSNTLINIYDNILNYDDHEISIIIYNNNMPWFSGINIAKILEYNDTRHAISNNVGEIDKKQFSELKEFTNKIPKNAQPHAIYINESGLYSLILSSKMPKALEFRKWVTEQVLPSIRKYGTYTVDENKILKHNQKKTKYDKGGLIYVGRPIDISNKKLFKLGKTEDINKRLYGYNTSLPNNMQILFSIKVADPDAVEHCMKAVLKQFIYRKNKEYYECSLKTMKEAVNKCISFIEYYDCYECQSRITSFRNLIRHMKNNHKFGDNDNVYFGTTIEDINEPVEQVGGDENDNKIHEICAIRHPKQKNIEFDHNNFMEKLFTFNVNNCDHITNCDPITNYCNLNN